MPMTAAQIEIQSASLATTQLSLEATLKAMTAQVMPAIEELKTLKEGGLDSEASQLQITTLNDKVQGFGPQFLAIQNEMNEVKQAQAAILEGIATSTKSAPTAGFDQITRTAGDLLTQNPRFKVLSKNGAAHANDTGGVPHVQYKGLLLGGMETKSAEGLWDPDYELAPQMDDPNIIISPRRVSTAREIFTVIPMPGIDLVRVRREVRRLECVMEATALANAGQKNIVVDSLAGLSLSTDDEWRDVVVLNSTEEAHEVDTATPANALYPNGPGTIVLIANLAEAVDPGELIVFPVSQYVSGARQRTKARATFETKNVQMRIWSEFVEVTEDELRSVAASRSIIDTSLLDKVGFGEEKNMYQGDGSTTNGGGLLAGVLEDTDVSTVTWSTSDTGTTKLEMVLNAATTCELLGYIPTVLCVNPADNRDLMKSSGSDGQYIFVNVAVNGEVPMMFGLEVHKTLNLPYKKGFVADSANAIRIYDSMVGEIAVGAPNNNFLDGTLTIRATAKSGFLIAHPGAICIIDWTAPPA